MEHSEGPSWLPEDGVSLTRRELERIMIALRALVDGTEPLEANRSHVVEIAFIITRAMDRGGRS